MADKMSSGVVKKETITNPLNNLETVTDLSNFTKQLKSIQREARKAIRALRELEKQKCNKYFVIELDELGNVPKVFLQR